MGLHVDNFSSRQFKKLAALQLSDKIMATESKQYIYLEKDKRKFVHKKLIKIFYRNTLENIRAKLDIVTEILENKNWLDIPELVLPEGIVTIDNITRGIKLPLIADNVNISLLLSNPKVCLKQKIKILKEILGILIKIDNIYEIQGKYFLGDIQDSNFILDINDQIIKAIDLDSSYFTGLTPFPSKYLTGNKMVKSFEKKYPIDPKTGLNIPSRETTYLQFAYMILNVLTDKPCHRLLEKDYYEVLGRLSDRGLDKVIVDFFESLYSREETLDIQLEDLDRIDYSKSYKI